MDLGSIFLILALLILVVLFLSRPFFEIKNPKNRRLSDSEDHEISTLLAERDRVLNALQELDFDFALGKIPEEDYPDQRAVLIQKGVVILRELDERQPDGSHGKDVESRIEMAVAARRADASPGEQGGVALVPDNGGPNLQGINPESDDILEVMIANRRRQRNGKAAGFCPKCGGPVQKTDRFCPKCGATLI